MFLNPIFPNVPALAMADENHILRQDALPGGVYDRP
jgi:hypothetical protein